MFLIKAVGGCLPGKWSLVTLVGVDIFIDGVVIGFAAGAKQGGPLLFALTLEIRFLGLIAAQEI